jgi:hypothetical protein
VTAKRWRTLLLREFFTYGNRRLQDFEQAFAALTPSVVGRGAVHVVWGTDALWTASPQWQIEGLRRLEIPEDLRKGFGFKPLGTANGPVKTAILSGNSARLYNYKASESWSKMDRFAAFKQEYLQAGPRRTNLRIATCHCKLTSSAEQFGNKALEGLATSPEKVSHGNFRVNRKRNRRSSAQLS